MNSRRSALANSAIYWRAPDGGQGQTASHMASGDNNSKREENICIHIFSVSAAMVGVCLTVIGLIRVVITLGRADTLADNLLAIDALMFLASCLFSYAALRANGLGQTKRIERVADWIFIAAMALMVAVCAFITYAVSIPPLK
jgi:hypothetical protein